MKKLLTKRNLLPNVVVICVLLFGVSITSFSQDVTNPIIESVLPAEGEVLLDGVESFKLTVDAFDENLFELEVDNLLENIIPEFKVYASEADPYGGAEAIFQSFGASVTYNAVNQTWVIDFGVTLTQLMLDNGGNEFYLVVRDDAVPPNVSGHMDQLNDEMTFTYSFAPYVPLSNWAIGIGLLLISGFIIVRFR